MPGSALIVNNRVMLAGNPGHAAIGGSRLLYIATRPGAVALPTEDDLRIERENALMAKLGYIGFRPGSVPEPNAGHALFDASGVPVRSGVQRELLATNSAIITSVLSVRFEDAETMRLSTKQDWERFVRAEWPRYVERMGVIAPENVRWVAAMHVCNHSYHVHVFTWDSSGRFNSLLPRQRMAEADDAIRHAALRPLREAPNLARKMARDELVVGVKEAVAEREDLREAVQKALPDAGSLKYANIARRHSSARQEVDSVVERVMVADRALSAKRDVYLAAAREHARLKGLTGFALAAHMAAAENDLHTRLGNAAIAAARHSLTEGREEPHRKATMAVETYDSPLERRRIRSMAEEASSFLNAGEQRALASMLIACSRGAEPDADVLRTVRKLPTIRAQARVSAEPFGVSFRESAIKGNRRIVRSLASSVKGRQKGDFGVEAGRRLIRESAMCLARALNIAALGMPREKVSRMSQSVAKDILINAEMKG